MTDKRAGVFDFRFEGFVGLFGLFVAACAAAAAACSSSPPRIVNTGDLPEGSGQPSVTSVLDLGGGDVPASGSVDLRDSDGIATIGETLLVRGNDFGRQPEVQVGGRPAAVLGRTNGGGILVRVPPGTPSGIQSLAVVTQDGRGEKSITVRRFAAMVAPQGQRLAWAEMTNDGPVAAGGVPLRDARFLRMSPDGRAAYVVGTRDSAVTVVAMPAVNSPTIVRTVEAGKDPVVALAAAAHAPVVAVVRADNLVMLDISSPLSPARSQARALPRPVKLGHVVAADLSPDGKTLAVALGEGNRVALLDVGTAGKLEVRTELALLGEEVRVRALVDVAFSPDGATLWALAGDNVESVATGPQPTRVFAIRRTGGDGKPKLELARTVLIEEAVAPTRISTGRSLPLASGSTIRLPPEKATVYVTATVRDAKRAAIFRLGAEDRASEMMDAQGVGTMGVADVTPDGRWLLAGSVGGDGSFRVVSTPADGRPGAPRSVEVVPARGFIQVSADRLRPAELRVQP